MLFAINEIVDDVQVREFLLTDPDFSAYILGDLEPPYRQHTRFFVASTTGKIEGIAVIYSGIDPPLLFLMGSQQALSALLLHGAGPDVVEFNIGTGFYDTFSTFYDVEFKYTATRMRLDKAKFKPRSSSLTGITIEPLYEKHFAQAEALLKSGADSDRRDFRDVAFDKEMLRTGLYYGAFEKEILIAIAGTHIMVEQLKLAAIGNVMVHADKRAKGLGRAVSQQVIQGLTKAGYTHIILNVQKENTAAEVLYKKLGFVPTVDFVQGIGKRI